MSHDSPISDPQAAGQQASPIAIVGMSCLFPKAPGLKEYWGMIRTGKDCVTEVPDSHWSASDYLDVICRAGREEHVALAIYGFLYGRGRDLWDSLRLVDVPANSIFLPHLMKSVAQDGKYYSIAHRPYRPALRLPRKKKL